MTTFGGKNVWEGPLLAGRHPIAWGAIFVTTPEKGWRCPGCGMVEKHKNRDSRIGMHHYPFIAVCTDCARKACMAANPRPVVRRIRRWRSSSAVR